MKKIILTAVMAVMAIGAQAQDWSKGDIFVGAKTTSLDLGISSYKKANVTEFDLGVEGGYFVADKFAVDANLGFGMYTEKYDGKKVDDSNAFRFGVGVRYYPVSNLYARLGFDGEKSKGVDMDLYAGLEVGYDFFVGENVFITPAVYFKKGLGDFEKKGTDESNNFGLAARFGFRF